MSLFRFQVPELSRRPSFDRFAAFRNDFQRLFDLAAPTRDSSSPVWSPALDVTEDKEAYVVSLEVPGLKKDDINLSFEEGVLTISGERKDERELKDGQTYRSERHFGKFQRSVSLTSAVDSAKVKATYKDGVLTVELPKAEEAKPKKIEISLS